MDITFTLEDREAGQPAQERRTALDQGQAPDVRWHMRKDGSRVFIDGMVRPLLGSDGHPIGLLKIGQDVTEQRANEAALRASESRQAFLLRLSDALRPLTDPDLIQGEAARILAERLDVDRASYVELDEAEGVARVGRDHVRDGAPSLAGEHRIAKFAWSIDLLRSKEGQVIADTRSSPLVPEAERAGLTVEDIRQGNSLQNWLETIVPADRTLAREAIETLRTGERLTFEYRITRPPEGSIRLLRETGFSIRDPNGRVLWVAGVGHDATDERASAERLKILVAELQHRTRNLLGVVLSITDRTVASSNSLNDFGERIHNRLGALARVNSLLSRLQEEDRIDFDELIRSELNAHGVLKDDRKGPQVTLNGPKKVRLRSSMVQTLALGLHELVTNAGKYGALSTPDGRLEVNWSLIRKKGAPLRLRVDWKESGILLDVTESAPVCQGYGRELIEQALPYQLSAEVDYKLTREGARCTITIPVATSMDEALPLTRQGHG